MRATLTDCEIVYTDLKADGFACCNFPTVACCRWWMDVCRCMSTSWGKRAEGRALLGQGLAMRREVPTRLDVSWCTVTFAVRIRYNGAVDHQNFQRKAGYSGGYRRFIISTVITIRQTVRQQIQLQVVLNKLPFPAGCTAVH